MYAQSSSTPSQLSSVFFEQKNMIWRLRYRLPDITLATDISENSLEDSAQLCSKNRNMTKGDDDEENEETFIPPHKQRQKFHAVICKFISYFTSFESDAKYVVFLHHHKCSWLPTTTNIGFYVEILKCCFLE